MAPDIEYSKIDEYLIHCYQCRIPVFLHGAPGIGKSAAVKRVAATLGIQCIDMRLTQYDAVDLRGIPILDERKSQTLWAIPKILPTEGQGILFLDELNLAPTSVQHAAYQLINDRRLGDYQLPKGWMCVAAGNRAEDRAHVLELPAPLANRFAHIELPIPPIKEWSQWAFNNKVDQRVIGFLQANADYLFRFDKQTSGRAFPTPRSWEIASRLITNITDIATIHSYIEMSVGNNAATQFITFVKYLCDIDVDAILNNYATYQLPQSDCAYEKLIIMILAVAMRINSIVATSDGTKADIFKTLENFLRFMTRRDMPEEAAILGLQFTKSMWTKQLNTGTGGMIYQRFMTIIPKLDKYADLLEMT